MVDEDGLIEVRKRSKLTLGTPEQNSLNRAINFNKSIFLI